MSAGDAQNEVGRREAELRATRRENLAALVARGADPYRTTRYPVTAHARELGERFAALEAAAGPSAERFALAGRLMALRKHGKNVAFADLWDRSGKLQLYVRADAVGEEAFARFDLLDRGDLVGVQGPLFRTKMGELTLRVESLEPLAKAIAPIPELWGGLQDVETRYRQRYLDLLMNEEVREVFIARSRIVAELRRFLDARGFLEMETAVLLGVAGGATARRFETHCNALDAKLELRIATELALKRLIVGGLERVYEIGRIFRNEGIDTTHNPEFTMLELYAAYWSVAEMMEFNEELIAHLARFARGGEELVVGGRPVSFGRPFARIAYLEALERWGALSRAELFDPEGALRIEDRLGIPRSPTHAHALDKIFERVAESHLLAPTFVYDMPLVLSPLAKKKPDDPELVERYELFASGFELSNAFTELNDPEDQRARFAAQVEERRSGDDEVPEADWDFVRALEYGMPPTAGIGIGIDRLVMLLTEQRSVRDVILFPLRRPLGR
ncbi:MAG: lysine--tRNA ligase [Vulcanimicrobiaceae bacterium]